MKYSESSLETLTYALFVLASLIIIIFVIAVFHLFMYQRCENTDYESITCELYRNF